MPKKKSQTQGWIDTIRKVGKEHEQRAIQKMCNVQRDVALPEEVDLHLIEDILYRILQVDSHIQTYSQLATASNLSEGKIYRLRKKYPEFSVVLQWLLKSEACRSCEAEETFSEHLEMKPCVGCEKIKMCEWGVDPFAYELYDDDTEMWLCGECHNERAGDI